MTLYTAVCATGVLILAIIIVIFRPALSRALTHHRQAQSGRQLLLRETIALDPRRRVHIVQCGQRHVLLLTGGNQDVVIGWLTEP